jgi:hypothetical protein
MEVSGVGVEGEEARGDDEGIRKKTSLARIIVDASFVLFQHFFPRDSRTKP